ncbi:hypothetical protein [Phaffia rhodozyma]|uniref:Uncharacterized protein n=1 Tax=Phaffia rhodozyma TaxID=264483 RepID=A0A0F7SNQ6_PHARH|nr:hypothetical protein [Phaffia rhodozyma]
MIFPKATLVTLALASLAAAAPIASVDPEWQNHAADLKRDVTPEWQNHAADLKRDVTPEWQNHAADLK